ncbi:MAG TPA: hypothetical protein VNU92_04065 [Edaphobacter sp.]|jgi:hypothetical protein|nr:hypothetical protein [Edaphobacter sp.]
MASIATLIDLNGMWASGGAPGPVITVFSNSFSVDMSAYGRPTAHGTILSASSISVNFPDAATFAGTLQPPGTIIWSNNSAWTKFALLFDLNGVWASGGVAGPVIALTGVSISIDMSAYGRPTAHGKILGATSISVNFPDAATFAGTLQPPSTIVWSNNSAWTKANLVLAPANILDIQNPLDATSIAQASAALQTLLAKIGQGKTFPLDQASEWIQPLSPDTEYDDTIVGTAGWAVNPRVVGGDFPFSHPFMNSLGNPNNQFDFEFSLAMDRPAANPTEYDYLLSLGNKAPTTNPDPNDERVKDEGIATRAGMNFPMGLLGVEMNSSHVPRDFVSNFQTSNRVAVFGRWIVDTGHALATQSGAQVQRTEIHPPLLTVAASTTDAVTTRAMFTSRPFLIGDTYTTDESKIYVDGASDDGTFIVHMAKELVKVNETILGIPTSSLRIEAHPKVKSFPFRGVHLMHIIVRPPAMKPTMVNQPHHLQVSYKFTVRTSCAVEVISSASDTVDIYVVMNQAGYKPPPLPANSYRSWSRDELAALNSEGGEGYLGADILSGVVQVITGGVIGVATVEYILSRGIKSDLYASLNDAVTLLDRSGMATGTVPGTIPQTGVVSNDGQPYPVFGWLEAKWVTNTVVADPGHPGAPVLT